MQSAGAAALAVGLAGCQTEEDTAQNGTDDGNGTEIEDGAGNETEDGSGNETDDGTNEGTDDSGDDSGEETGEESESKTMPVLEVTSKGLPQEKATAFAEELGVDGEFEVSEDGILQYIDEESYMPIPDGDVDPREATSEEETDGQDLSMAMDLAALEELPEPPSADELQDTFVSAMRATEPLPAEPLEITQETSHASIGIGDLEEDTTVLERDLDTAVYVSATFEGVSLEGPGAKIRGRASDLGEGTVWSDVRHSFRQVDVGDEVPVLSADDAKSRYREALDQTVDAEIGEIAEPRLVYFAPELTRDNDNPLGDGPNEVQALVPHYVVGGTATVQGEEFELLREYMPAVDDAEYVPELTLEASAEGSEVTASVSVDGGQQPYKIDWSVADGSLSLDPTNLGDPAEISETITARESFEETTLSVEVTDANGVSVREQTTLSASVSPAMQPVGIPVGGAGESGVGSGVAGWGTAARASKPGRNDVGYRSTDFTGRSDDYLVIANRANQSVSSAWENDDVWEKDYTPSFDNEEGLDTADHFFTLAHGNPQGYAVPNNCCDDGWVSHTDTDEAWGNYDAEWHSLMSCKVLAPNDSDCGGCNGEGRIQRWWQEFDGLHQLHGFQTLGYATKGFAKHFARWVFGQGLFWNAKKMRVAWILAVDNYQPGYRGQDRKKRGVVLAPMDENKRCPKGDYFWGQGSVGPDIPHEDVRYIWWLVAGTGGG
jgi:hypothetical protein